MSDLYFPEKDEVKAGSLTFSEEIFIMKFSPKQIWTTGIIAFVVIVILGTWAFGIQRVNVNGGQVAVLVKKPYFVGRGGIDKEPVITGSEWVAASTENIIFSTVPKEYPEQFKDMNTSDNFPVHFETNLQLQVIGEKTPELLEKFDIDWYVNNVKQKFREIVRDEVGQKHMTPLVTRSPQLDEVQKNVSIKIGQYIASIGLPVRFIRITFSQIDPNEKVIQERADTAQQQQRIQTESQRKLAEDGRKEAELSRAAADKAYASAMNLSPDQFVALESIKAGERMVDTCMKGGKGGCNLLVNAGGAKPQPMMTIK